MQKLKFMLTGFFLGSLFFSGISNAENVLHTLDVAIPQLKLVVNGQEVKPQNNQESFIYNGTTYVPIRMLAQSLGNSVLWDGEKSTIYMSNGATPKIIDLDSMKSQRSQDKGIETITTFKSNDGQTFTRGIKIQQVYDKIENQPIAGSLFREYILNNHFDRFTASIAPDITWGGGFPDSNIGEVKVYADNKLLYRSGAISSNSKPIKINLPLSEVNKLQVQVKNGENLCILDGKFFIK